jgi:hypothetical protein
VKRKHLKCQRRGNMKKVIFLSEDGGNLKRTRNYKRNDAARCHGHGVPPASGCDRAVTLASRSCPGCWTAQAVASRTRAPFGRPRKFIIVVYTTYFTYQIHTNYTQEFSLHTNYIPVTFKFTHRLHVNDIQITYVTYDLHMIYI